MDGEGDGSKVEVVEQHRQVVVEASGGGETQLQSARGHTRDGAMLLGAPSLVREPQLNRQTEVSPLQRLLYLMATNNNKIDLFPKNKTI